MTERAVDQGSLSDLVAERIKDVRRRAGLTTKDLADRCASIGASQLTAPVLMNIESGRRDEQGRRRRNVTVDELIMISCALDVSPLALLLPRANVEYHITPEVSALAITVGRWLIGVRPFPLKAEGPVHPGENAAREAWFISENPPYLQSSPEPLVEWVDEDPTNALLIFAKAIQRSGRSLSEVVKVKTEAYIGADPERITQVEADLAGLRERLQELMPKGGESGQSEDQADTGRGPD